MRASKQSGREEHMGTAQFIDFIDSELKSKMKNKCDVKENADDDILNNRDFYVDNPVIFKLLDVLENADVENKIDVFNGFTDNEKCLIFGLDATDENMNAIDALSDNVKTNLLNHQIQLIKRVRIKLNDDGFKKQILCMDNTYNKLKKSLRTYIDFNGKTFTPVMYQDILHQIISPIIQTELYKNVAGNKTKRRRVKHTKKHSKPIKTKTNKKTKTNRRRKYQ